MTPTMVNRLNAIRAAGSERVRPGQATVKALITRRRIRITARHADGTVTVRAYPKRPTRRSDRSRNVRNLRKRR